MSDDGDMWAQADGMSISLCLCRAMWGGEAAAVGVVVGQPCLPLLLVSFR
jgi:Na+-transporting NADH:ubiquinone oxidoreductase subunit NqrB